MIDSDYASNLRSIYYKYDKIKHNMRNYTEINTLINQEIIYQDNTDHLVWDKKDINSILVWLMYDLL